MIRGHAPKGLVNEWGWRPSSTRTGESMIFSEADQIELGWLQSLFEYKGRWGIGTHRAVVWFEDEDAARMAWAMGFRFTEAWAMGFRFTEAL